MPQKILIEFLEVKCGRLLHRRSLSALSVERERARVSRVLLRLTERSSVG